MAAPARKSMRLADYDYASPGAYFVTVCTHGKMYDLATVENGNMILSPEGEIVRNTWLNLPQHYQEIFLDEFVVMPNHFHGILFITEATYHPVGAGLAQADKRFNPVGAGLESDSRKWDESLRPAPTRPGEDLSAPVGAGLENDSGYLNDSFRPAPTGTIGKRHALPEIMRGFKSLSAKIINFNRNTPGQPFWQRGYYEHIIRDEKSLDQIRVYIANNPQNWSLDHENSNFTGIDSHAYNSKLVI